MAFWLVSSTFFYRSVLVSIVYPFQEFVLVLTASLSQTRAWNLENLTILTFLHKIVSPLASNRDSLLDTFLLRAGNRSCCVALEISHRKPIQSLDSSGSS